MRRAPRSKLRAVLVAASLSAAGCALLVQADTYGEHCRFSGEETACGRCLRGRCQPAIDACCVDQEACASTLSAVEGCAARADEACDGLIALQSRAGTGGTLATCARRLCGAVCQAFAGTSDTTCTEPPFGRGSTCACTYAPLAGNNFQCSPASYDGTICCAPESWPAPGVECTCRPISCFPVPDGCSCRLVDTPPQKNPCDAPPCCVADLDPEQCSCRPSCLENERPVPSCDATTGAIGCAPGQKRVESCSVRRP